MANALRPALVRNLSKNKIYYYYRNYRRADLSQAYTYIGRTQHIWHGYEYQFQHIFDGTIKSVPGDFLRYRMYESTDTVQLNLEDLWE